MAKVANSDPFQNIKDIHKYTRGNIAYHDKYLLDANVWLYILNPGEDENGKPYLDFFARLVDLHLRPIDKKHKPMVVMTSVLFAEILHAHLLKRMLPNYLKAVWKSQNGPMVDRYLTKTKNSTTPPTYSKFENWFTGKMQNKIAKKDFDGFVRYKKTKHFKEHIKRAQERFAQYSQCMAVGVHVSFDYETMVDILFQFGNSTTTTNAGVNDYYYYYFCRKLGIPMVTNDRDFAFGDLKVVTANEKLLALKGK